jgi:hypothetical protein
MMVVVVMIIQFFIYLHVELNSQWPTITATTITIKKTQILKKYSVTMWITFMWLSETRGALL